MSTQIDITENGTTTLATAGKYCDRNIDVNVAVPVPDVSYTALLDGTISGVLADDKVTYLRYAAFHNCTNLTQISLPNCVEAYAGYTFNNCRNVQTIDLPNLEAITESASRVFFGMRAVREINLPNLITAPAMNATFSMCVSVEKINLPKLGGTTIQALAFNNCYKLHTLVLGGDTRIELANTNAFSNAGIETTSGLSIYVPDNLVDTYKTATNWSAYADKIKPMSELEE